MQNINWDDLRFVIALSRSDSFSEAARALSVNSTTVARRLETLESKLGAQLLHREGSLGFQLTEVGLDALRVAERTRDEIEQLQERSANTDLKIQGDVCITAVPVLCNRILLTRLGGLSEMYPQLNIQLRADTNNLSLRDREADIAIRLNRPNSGGHQLKTRRIGSLDHGIYIAKNTAENQSTNAPWLTYIDSTHPLPQAQWIQRQLCKLDSRRSNVQVAELEGAIEAVALGYGRSVLPCMVGDADPRLRRMRDFDSIETLQREVWLLCRSENSELARIRTILEWLRGIFSHT